MTEQVLKDFSRVRAYSIKLCAPLEIEDFVVQPLADVSPPKWHQHKLFKEPGGMA